MIARLITRTIDLLYLPPLPSLVPRQVYRYAACGALTLALDTVWYFVLYNFVVGPHTYVDLRLTVVSPHIASLALVFPITFFNGFWLNRHVAFRESTLRTRSQLARYALTVAGSILLNYVFVKGLVEWADLWPTPAKFITSLLVALYSFLAAKYFTFRR